MSRSPVPSLTRTVAVAALTLAGCATFEPAPLVDADELAAVLDERRSAAARLAATASPGPNLSIRDAWEAARRRSPDLADARATAAVPRALADTPIPLPNPTLFAGPLLLAGADVPADHRWGFEAVAGWLLDLSGSRAAEASLREAVAHEAAVRVVAAERDAWLALRRNFVLLAQAEEAEQMQASVVGGLRESLDIGRRLVDAAQATALDVREFEVELHRARADGVVARGDAERTRAALAGLTGLPAGLFHAPEVPAEPESVPAEDELPGRIVRDHPGLARLRAGYDVAEAELRSAVRAAWPDLEIEGSVEREEDEETYGLGLGIELPLFDRNQPQIAERLAAREAARTAFRSELLRRVSVAEGARTAVLRARERLRILRDDALPAAEAALDLSRRALQAGSAGALHVLSVARAEREVRLEVIEAEGALRAAWIELEDACGSPFLRFASLAEDAESAAEGDER